MPPSVISIGVFAFTHCKKLESISLSENIEFIGSRAFYCCESLLSIKIPPKITTIIDDMFAFCYNLSSVEFLGDIISIGSYSFFYNNFKNINIQETVESIREHAFANCKELISIEIPKTISIIEYGLFSGCSKLESINLLANITFIGEEAFQFCEGLTSFSFNANYTSIENGAFFACTKLSSLTIYGNITEVGYWAFGRCQSLISLTYFGLINPVNDSDVFINSAFENAYVTEEYKDDNFCGYPIAIYVNDSQYLTNTETIKETTEKSIQKVTFSLSFSISYVKLRSVSFSISYFMSNTYLMSDHSYINSQMYFYSYFPYIIFYLSPTYVSSYIILDINKKRTITGEQLIAIVCGSVSVFFFILMLIILIIRKRNEAYYIFDNDYFSTSDVDTSKTADENKPEVKQEQNDNTLSSDSDINFWIS